MAAGNAGALIDVLVTRLTAVEAQWAGIVASRISEQPQLDAVIGRSGSFAHFTGAFSTWKSDLAALKAVPKRRLAVVEQQLVQLRHSLSALKNALESAGNGVQWLIDNRSLPSWLVITATLFDTVKRETHKDRATAAELVKSNLSEELDLVAHGADVARN